MLALYDQLLVHSPTPIVVLNRAVAVAEVHGPAMALATLGIAVMLGSLGALLLIAAEVAVMTVGIRYEERVLHREFGEEYDAYRRRVRRWI